MANIIGELVFQRIFDLGGTLQISKVRELLSRFADVSTLTTPRSAPEYLSFAHPVPLNLDSLGLNLHTPDNRRINASARLYGVGGLAVMLRVPVQCDSLGELQGLLTQKVMRADVPNDPLQIADEIYRAIEPVVRQAYDEVFPEIVESERYHVFCLTSVPDGAEKLMKEQRHQIAALLINDPRPDKLSQGNVEDITRNWFNYYTDDLVVADWDAAFLVEPEGKYEDLLYVFEVANLELLLLRKYDLYLDHVLNKGYDQYETLLKGNPFFERGARDILAKLSEVRMDLAEVTDELDNVAKFFGDYYLARVFLGLSSKLHVTDYHETVDEKLATLNDLYRSIVDYLETRQNLVLEWAIVLLIVFEIVMAFVRK